MSQSKETCLKKSNLLVYQNPSGQKEKRKAEPSKKSSPYAATINRVQPKVIRVCTGADMKRMCRPPIDCKTVIPKKPGFVAFAGAALKMAFAFACIYVTYDLGVWGTTDETQELYRKLCHMKSGQKKPNDKWVPASCAAQKEMLPATYFKSYEHCEQPMFFTERTVHEFQNKWNRAVQNVFITITQLPQMLKRWNDGRNEILKEERLKAIPFNELSDDKKIFNVYKH